MELKFNKKHFCRVLRFPNFVSQESTTHTQAEKEEFLYKQAFMEQQAVEAALTRVREVLPWYDMQALENWGSRLLEKLWEELEFSQGVLYYYNRDHSAQDSITVYDTSEPTLAPFESYRNQVALKHLREHLSVFHTENHEEISASFPNIPEPHGDMCCSLVAVPLLYNQKLQGILEMVFHAPARKRTLEMLSRMSYEIGAYLFGLVHEKQSQEAVQLINQSRQDMVNIIDSSPGGMIILWRKNGVIERVNDAMTRILGYAKVELRYTTFEQLVYEPDREGLFAEGERLVREDALQNSQTEKRMLHKNGTVRWCSMILSSVLQRGEEMVVVQVQDISERKKAEAELEKNRRNLAEAQRIAQMGSWEWDVQRNIVTWSEEMYRIYGYDPKEYLPAYHNSYKRVHPDDRDRARSMIRRAIDKGEPFDFFQRIIRQDGEERIIHSRGTVEQNAKGEPVKIFGTGQDVTKMKQMERRLLEQERASQQKLEQQVKERTQELQEEKEKLEQTNTEILSSMTYARRIQVALLPQKKYIQKYLPEFFIYYVPKDIVSGDFYWFGEKSGKCMLAAVDCTGHGIPGALMSMIGNDLLNEIIYQRGITDPEVILEEMDKGIKRSLRQSTTRNRDGMDVALCSIDLNEQKMVFAGAHNPLVYVQNGEVHHIKGDRRAVGGRKTTGEMPFQRHEVSLESETMLYIFSDGYQDQFGGKENKKFMSKRFRKVLHDIHHLSMDDQELSLDKALGEWMGNQHKQIDDILVIGVRVPGKK